MIEFERAPYESGISSGRRSELLNERSLVVERDNIDITPEALIEDNHSLKSRELTDQWRENRDSGNLIIEEPCSDARPPEAVSQNITRIPSIAASGSIEPYYRIYTGPQSKGIILKPHYSKLLFTPGQIPRGCGGSGAKEQMMLNGEESVEGDIGRYVAKLPHADPLINALYKSQTIANFVDKPVLATAQDHISGEVKPFAWFQRTPRGTIEFQSAVPLNWLFANNYSPEIIYAEGIPELKRQDLPEVFRERLAEYDAYNDELHHNFEDFEESQKVQNPKTIILSTNIKPRKILNPVIFGLPGSVFEVRAERNRFEGEDTVNDESLREALNQIHYPIAHSVKNHENNAKDFSKTNRVLIETSDIDLSLQLACELSEKLWMRQWMQLPNHRILVSQARGGRITKAEYLT